MKTELLGVQYIYCSYCYVVILIAHSHVFFHLNYCKNKYKIIPYLKNMLQSRKETTQSFNKHKGPHSEEQQFPILMGATGNLSVSITVIPTGSRLVVGFYSICSYLQCMG